MWALKRKLTIYFIFFLIISLVAFFVFRSFFVEEISCFDQKKNGTEQGVDCGGECEQVCRVFATDINTLWVKTFEVTSGVANVAALVENPNFDFNIEATYNIKIFNEKGLRIEDFEGKINLKPAEKRIIFIPSVLLDKQKAAQTFIDFKNINSLTKANPEKNNLSVTSKLLLPEKDYTSAEIKVKNNNLIPKRDVEVYVILKEKNGNIKDVGKTFIEYIPKREEEKATIIWPKNFDSEEITIDVYLRELKI